MKRVFLQFVCIFSLAIFLYSCEKANVDNTESNEQEENSDDAEFCIETLVVVVDSSAGSTTTIMGYSPNEWECVKLNGGSSQLNISGLTSGGKGAIAITIESDSQADSSKELSATFRITSNGESIDVKAIQPAYISSSSQKDSNYSYWPAYDFQTDLSLIEEQVWSESDHTIEGWDFSMPPSAEVSDRSFFITDRSMAYKQTVDNVSQTSLRINPSCEMWITWKDIEPTEDGYIWDEVKAEIAKVRAQGYTNIALRILTSGYKRKVNSIYQREKGYAPLWLDDYLNRNGDDPAENSFDFTLHTEDNSDFLIWDGWDNSNGVVVCYDPENPTFHKYYLELVESFKENGMANIVDAAYVGYGYRSHGEEYICKHDTSPHGNVTVEERLDAWHSAFEGQEYKIYMGGPTDYGFAKGFGVRRGYVEKYWYTIPDISIGQEITDNGYLWVNEDTYVIKEQAFNCEVNEEFEESWTSSYGDLSTFPYRYFMSMMRMLQMRCTAVVVNGNLIPEMLPFISLQLARTIDDTPDIWSFMCQSTLKNSSLSITDYNDYVHSYTSDIETKNFERWLYQRDKVGYETVPTMAIQQPDNMSSWCRTDYDFIARRGARIGFYADSRFGSGRKAVKVTYLDNSTGEIELHYYASDGTEKVASIELTGDEKFRTATLILEDMALGKAGYSATAIESASGADYDFILKASSEAETITISMVRIVNI